MINDIKKKANEAIEVAEDLPEGYKEKAFEVVLTHLLQNGQPTENMTNNSQKVTSPRDENELENNSLSGWEERLIQNQPEAYVISDHGTRKQQAAWAIIELYKENKEGTVENLRSVIKEKIGLTPESSDNTYRTLGKLHPKYLDRSKPEDIYVYSPTVKLIEVFESLPNNE